METLTKENFWNDLQTAYPEEVKVFYDWLDKYEERVEWDQLFNNDNYYKTVTKFHGLPIAFQIGVFIQFAAEINKHDPLKIPERIRTITEFEEFPRCIQNFFSNEHLWNERLKHNKTN